MAIVRWAKTPEWKSRSSARMSRQLPSARLAVSFPGRATGDKLTKLIIAVAPTAISAGTNSSRLHYDMRYPMLPQYPAQPFHRHQ